MNYQVTIQNPEDYNDIPSVFKINRWVKTCLKHFKEEAEVTLRFSSTEEIQRLNFQYRQKNKPTNVLSFPIQLPKELADTSFIGDIILCKQVIEQEAKAQHKTLEAHYAHMIIHGLLHLLGFDHIKEEDALVMEPLEIKILKELHIENPYEV